MSQGIVTRQDEIVHYKMSLKSCRTREDMFTLVLMNLQGYRRGNNQINYDAETLGMFFSALKELGI